MSDKTLLIKIKTSAEGLPQIEQFGQALRGVGTATNSAATAVQNAGMTWKQFVADRMSEYMKLEGSHGAAMKRLGEEWRQYQATATAAAKAVQAAAAGAGPGAPPKLPGGGAAPGLPKSIDDVTARLKVTSGAFDEFFKKIDEGGGASAMRLRPLATQIERLKQSIEAQYGSMSAAPRQVVASYSTLEARLRSATNLVRESEHAFQNQRAAASLAGAQFTTLGGAIQNAIGDKFGVSAAGAVAKVGLITFAVREAYRAFEGLGRAAGLGAGIDETQWWVTRFGKKVGETILQTNNLTKALQFAHAAAAYAGGDYAEVAATSAAMEDNLLALIKSGLRYRINPKAYGSASDVMGGAIEEFRAQRQRELEFNQRILSTQRERAAFQGNEGEVRKLDAAIASLNVQQLQLQGYSLAAAQSLVSQEAATRKLIESTGKADKLKDFQSWVKQLSIEASGQGTDLLTERLAEIQKRREEQAREANRRFKETKDRGLLDKATAEIERGAQRASLEEINKPVLENTRRLAQARRDIELQVQRQTEDDRLALIADANKRELAQNLATVRRWAEDRRKAIDDAYDKQIEMQEKALDHAVNSDDASQRKNAEAIARSIAQLKAQKDAEIEVVAQAEERENKLAKDAYQRRLDEQKVATEAWGSKLSEALKARFQNIGAIVIDAIVGVRGALAEALGGFLEDLTSGQADVMKTLTGLAHSLARVWTNALTEILTNNGGNVLTQFKALWSQMMKPGLQGVLGGASFGSFVGGMFQTPNNYAGLGGTIGGALGAVIGTYFGNTGLGAVIGSAIGTAIGSMIQKGKDQIKVAIVNGVATVTEKGISAEARHDLETQINRRIHDEMKAWQGILDLFPERVREAIKDLHPTLNLTGGVENADITDEGALNALQDFLGNKLPKAAFSAYEGAIRKALEVTGVGAGRITELFKYWGSLQGKELQDAVRTYVTTLVNAVNIRDKFKNANPLVDAMAQFHLTPDQDFSKLDAISGKMATVVASMSKLTDIDDITAAQQEVTRLAQQYWDMQVQMIARVLDLQRQSHDSILQQREQIHLLDLEYPSALVKLRKDLAAATDEEERKRIQSKIDKAELGVNQSKLDYFYERMATLREKMLKTSDPEQISRLQGQIQEYVSMALNLAPDNKENRDKLKLILDDIDSLASDAYEKAIEAIQKRQERPATLLEQAAKMLMQAADDLSGGKPKEGGGDEDTGGGGGGGGGRDEGDENNKKNATIGIYAVDSRLQTTNELLASLRDAEASLADEIKALLPRPGSTQAEQATRQQQSVADAQRMVAAIREALAGMQFQSGDLDINVDGIDPGSVITESVRQTITLIRRNPDAIASRTGV